MDTTKIVDIYLAISRLKKIGFVEPEIKNEKTFVVCLIVWRWEVHHKIFENLRIVVFTLVTIRRKKIVEFFCDGMKERGLRCFRVANVGTVVQVFCVQV